MSNLKGLWFNRFLSLLLYFLKIKFKCPQWLTYWVRFDKTLLLEQLIKKILIKPFWPSRASHLISMAFCKRSRKISRNNSFGYMRLKDYSLSQFKMLKAKGYQFVKDLVKTVFNVLVSILVNLVQLEKNTIKMRSKLNLKNLIMPNRQKSKSTNYKWTKR